MADEMFDELDEEEAPTFELELDDGSYIECECIDELEYEGERYVVLLPYEEDDEDGSVEIMILKVEPVDAEDEDDEEEYEQYVDVESEDLLATLFELFKEKNAGKFDFIDE